MMKQLSESGKSTALGIIALLLGTLFVGLFFEQGIGLNFPLYVYAATLGGLLLAYEYKRPPCTSHCVVIGSALFFSTMVFIRASDLLSFFNVLASVLLLFIGVELFAGKQLRAFLFVDYIKTVFLPFRFIVPFFETFPAVISFRNISGEGGRTREIIRGSFMAILAVAIFAALLSSADVVFNKLLAHIFSLNIDERTLARLLLGTFMTAFFIGAFGFMFRKLHPAPVPSAPEKTRPLGMLETTILFSAINMLFAVFIILQVPYLFGGTAHLIATDLTYSEYARDGFTQLVWVAILSYFIISFAERQIVQHEGTHSRRFMLLSGTLVCLVIAILISAWCRLSLYEDAYGFTVIRLYSHALMLWLGCALMLLSLHIWKSGRRAQFALRVFASLLIFLFSMNLLNPDAFIARQNLERYSETGKIDAEYLGGLSSDALPYTIGLMNDSRKDVRSDFAFGLYYARNYKDCRYEDCRSKHPSDSWQSIRWGAAEGERLLAPYQGMLTGEREIPIANPTSSSM